LNILTSPIKDRPFGLRTYVEILEEGLQYIKDRQSGKVKSLSLPWTGLNSVGVGGLEWGSMLTIGARPGSGKTMFVSQILRESKYLNPTQDFNILEFQFEMGAKQTASRDFASQVGLDYNQVLSTYKQVDEFSVKLMQQYLDDTRSFQKYGNFRTQINEPLTVKQMEEAIYKVYDGLGGKPLIVTVDHSWLIKKDINEKEKIATLYNVVEMLMKVKNKLPIIVFMISQLNRSIDEPLRKTPGTIGNYPTSSDIFGGDALQQGSDMVLVLTRPYKAEIEIYGRKEYPCKTDDVFAHILKSRNSADDTNLVFLKAEFAKQRMIEVGEPTANNPTGAPAMRRTTNRFNNNTPPII
jgi:replicative DNA helicase